ncbi:MAG: hypothetical protein MR820_05115, partial [Prevotella sp.]|nr:hypothetical protein [Prevotella sp.]
QADHQERGQSFVIDLFSFIAKWLFFCLGLLFFYCQMVVLLSWTSFLLLPNGCSFILDFFD